MRYGHHCPYWKTRSLCIKQSFGEFSSYRTLKKGIVDAVYKKQQYSLQKMLNATLFCLLGNCEMCNKSQVNARLVLGCMKKNKKGLSYRFDFFGEYYFLCTFIYKIQYHLHMYIKWKLVNVKFNNNNYLQLIKWWKKNVYINTRIHQYSQHRKYLM